LTQQHLSAIPASMQRDLASSELQFQNQDSKGSRTQLQAKNLDQKSKKYFHDLTKFKKRKISQQPNTANVQQLFHSTMKKQLREQHPERASAKHANYLQH